MKVLSFVAILYLISPSLAQSPQCVSVPPGEIYLFPYPGVCSRYIRCEGGVATVQTCSGGLWFSEPLQSCDHPENTGCINLSCPPGIVDFYPDPLNCQQYIECYQGVAETHTCPAGLWFNAGEKRCVSESQSGCGQYSTSVEPTWTTPNPVCYGVRPGQIILRPYPGECNLFHECIGSQDTVLSCPPYFFFDEERQMCLQEDLVICDGYTGTPNPSTPHGIDDPRCANGNTDYWPDPDCTKFIECYNGQGYLLDCPSGLYFNPEDSRCEDPGASNCGHTADPYSTTPGGGGSADPDCPFPSNDRYLFPYPGDCTKFLECYYGRKEAQDCPPGLWFNPHLLVCDYPYEADCAYGLVK